MLYFNGCVDLHNPGPYATFSFHKFEPASMVGGRPGVEALLRSSLAHIPTKGFTASAIRTTIEEQNTHCSSDIDRALSILFPGPASSPTSAPRLLLQTWDLTASESVKEKYTKEKRNDFELTVRWLCTRLAYNDPVRPHLSSVCALCFRINARSSCY